MLIQIQSYRSLWLAILLGLLVFGCRNETESVSENGEVAKEKFRAIPSFESISTDQVFAYNCGDTLEFTAHVTPDSTWLFLADTTVKVLPVVAGSGARYEGNRYIYWSKGDEAILQKPKGSFTTCQSDPKEKAWAAAQIRGVDFRALGQEPGWFIEIKEGGKTQYVGNYGKDSIAVATPDPQINEELQRTVYRPQTDERTLELIITNRPCTDSMSGHKFPQTVSVTIDNETYQGCGRYL
jgi:putative lipoprotein